MKKKIGIAFVLLVLFAVGALVYAASDSDVVVTKESDTTFKVKNTANSKLTNARIAIDLITSKSPDGKSDVCVYHQTGAMAKRSEKTVTLSELGYGPGNKIYRVAVGSCYFDE